jgi:hypothetical protein
MLVRVAIADLSDRLGLSQKLLCGVVHCRLNTSGFVRREDFHRYFTSGLCDLGEVQLLANFGKGIDGDRSRGGKWDAIV